MGYSNDTSKAEKRDEEIKLHQRFNISNIYMNTEKIKHSLKN